MLTGMSPEIARTMVQLNIDVAGMRTMRTLKDGLRACFEILRQARQRRQRYRQKSAPGGGEAQAAGDGLNLLSYSHSPPGLTELSSLEPSAENGTVAVAKELGQNDASLAGAPHPAGEGSFPTAVAVEKSAS
jgi:hypothetical protein